MGLSESDIINANAHAQRYVHNHLKTIYYADAQLLFQ